MEILRGRGGIKHKIIRGKCEAENLSYYNELVMGHIYLDVYREDITRWHEDMNFIFEWQNNILRTRAASE